MHALMLGIAWGIMGLDVGWRPAAGGGVEYIIQIAPNELEVFKTYGIEGDIPPQLKDIRMYRVVVGNDVLPRQDPPPDSAAVSSRSSNSNASLPFSPPIVPQTKGYSPFTALSSLVSRYPFGQVAADSTRTDSKLDASKTESPKAAPARPWPRNTDSTAERWWTDGPGKIERPADRGSVKEAQEPPQQIARPWLPFTVVVLALFGSLGGNLYMGWITWETRARYHALVRRFRKRGSRLATEDDYGAEDD